MSFNRRTVRLISVLAVTVSSIGSAQTEEDEVLTILTEELNRALSHLQNHERPPYYLSYEITHDVVFDASASFGAVSRALGRQTAFLDIDLRVGDYQVDSTHPMRNDRGQFSAPTPISVDDPEALRTTLWLLTDQKYKQAVERYDRVLTETRVTVAQEDTSGDFSSAKKNTHTDPMLVLDFDRDVVARKVSMYTAPFADANNVRSNSATISGNIETRWFVNSEGSAIRVSHPVYQLSISASTRAEDGMDLPRYETFHAHSLDGLPDDETVLGEVETMISDLDALRDAPIVDPYTGPAILSGRASGVFFHEILGHRLEGHRQKLIEEGQTFKKQLGERVLPRSFSVTFDPTIAKFGSTDLTGTYRYDNEGVPAQRVPVIENGKLTRFLMSRVPIDGFPESNGHGRKNYGRAVVARQSNMFIEVKKLRSYDDLKKRLIRLARKDKKEFGLLFDHIQGGVTITGRSLPQAFNVIPVMVYKIYTDGRQELVRGVDLIGTPLTAFSNIVDAGGEMEVFKRNVRCRIRIRSSIYHCACCPSFSDRGAEESTRPKHSTNLTCPFV